MKYYEFCSLVPDSRLDICRQVYLENRDQIKIKKEKTVLRNLEKISRALLEVGVDKGFQAMTVRDLCRSSTLSMGALYSYFSSKEEILRAFLNVGRKIICQVLEEFIGRETDPVARLEIAVQVHLFLSEKMQKWFYFSYMEARNLNPAEKENAVQSELYTEKLIEDVLSRGHAQGVFTERNHVLAASVIKSMLQDWYLKRGKYAKRQIDVDQYAAFIISFIKSFYLRRGDAV